MKAKCSMPIRYPQKTSDEVHSISFDHLADIINQVIDKISSGDLANILAQAIVELASIAVKVENLEVSMHVQGGSNQHLYQRVWSLGKLCVERDSTIVKLITEIEQKNKIIAGVDDMLSMENNDGLLIEFNDMKEKIENGNQVKVPALRKQ